MGLKLRVTTLLLLPACAFLLCCRSTYLGRMATLHGPDVEDYRHLPTRAVPHAPGALPLERRPDPDWMRKVVFSSGTERIDEPGKLDALLSRQGSTAFIILHQGKVIDERYFNGYSRDTLCKSFSMSKSVLSALLGIAQADGLINSNDLVSRHVATPGNPALGEVRLEQLLDNVSGFKYERGFAPWKQQPRMYYTTDVREYVRTAEFAHAPGSTFEGEDLSPLLLGVVLEAALRKRDPNATLSDYAAKRLWQPLGAEFPALWVTDRENDGLEKTESGFVARAIDLARFGQLYLDRGAARGQHIVPETWVAASVSAPPAGSPNLFQEGFYQNLWWGYFRPQRRQHDFYANGHFGQRIYVSPDKALVIVRMGSATGDINWTEFLATIADAWPTP